MSVAEALALDGLRLELEGMVDGLTLGEKRRLDDGRLATTMALLDGVEDAQTTRDRSGDSARYGEAAPVRLGALELLAEVGYVVRAHRRPGQPLTASVRAWAVSVAARGQLVELEDAVELVRDWTGRGHALSAPRRSLPLRGATCPQCGARDVVEDGSAGERVVSPALVADLRAGSVGCRAAGCEAVWHAEHLHLLAEHLDRQTMHEVLASE